MTNYQDDGETLRGVAEANRCCFCGNPQCRPKTRDHGVVDMGAYCDGCWLRYGAVSSEYLRRVENMLAGKVGEKKTALCPKCKGVTTDSPCRLCRDFGRISIPKEQGGAQETKATPPKTEYRWFPGPRGGPGDYKPVIEPGVAAIISKPLVYGQHTEEQAMPDDPSRCEVCWKAKCECAPKEQGGAESRPSPSDEERARAATRNEGTLCYRVTEFVELIREVRADRDREWRAAIAEGRKEP